MEKKEDVYVLYFMKGFVKKERERLERERKGFVKKK